MSVTGVSSTDVTAAAANATSNQLQGTKDEFLKLFMAQLQNQDPLNPQQGADMVAQLAQFSSVEQAQETNQQLQSLTAAQASTASASLSSLVGRTCDAATGDFQLAATGAVPPLSVSANGAMNGAAVVITDANGKELRRIPIPPGSTSASIQWDGCNASGQRLAAGSYHVAVDPGTTTASITANWQGRVDAVQLTSSGTLLAMGGLLVPPSDISTIGVLQ
ncbi:MAG TPA: flagellar hook assembly protein FlgD [Kofleriaceae bacterium]|jgi:flagellar basal-body rod modification protein FlgD